MDANDPAVIKRVARLVALGPYHLRGLERLAARYWFSLLGDLETIAVYASEKGDCVPGQYEDELVHRDAFYQIADGLGGRLPASAPVAELITFLKTLDGVMSISLMNVVAEKWLENIFRALERSGMCPELFASVGEDEKRHVYGALLLPKGDPEEAQALMVHLEILLREVARDPQFLLPLSFLVGEEQTARIGLGNVKAHRAACAHLGVESGQPIHEIEVACRASLMKSNGSPDRVELNPWEVSKFRMSLGEMQDSVEVHCDLTDFSQIESEVVKACGTALALFPKLNRTIRGGMLFQPKEVIIGVRRIHSAGMVTTIHVDTPQRKTVSRIGKEVSQKLKRVRRRRYESIPDVANLIEFAPPPRAALTITQTASCGVRRGFAPTSSFEGAPISVCIGVLDALPGTLHLGIRYDHRAGDGEQIGALVRELTQSLTRALRIE